MSNPVPILISNYHGGDVLKLCVESIRHYTPAGTYRIIIGNDYDPSGTDDEYLRECRDKGWLEFKSAASRVHHGGVLNMLWNETDLGRATVAVNMDNDVQIKGHGWLDDILSAFRNPLTLGTSDMREHNCVSKQGYVPPMFRFWLGALSVPAYRDIGQVDWQFAYADRREYPYSEMFKDVEGIPYPQKKSPEWDSNRVAIDPGSKLWIKLKYDNPKGYWMVPLPGDARMKHQHIGHVSHMVDLPDDYDDYVLAHKQMRRELVASELRRLRCLS